MNVLWYHMVYGHRMQESLYCLPSNTPMLMEKSIEAVKILKLIYVRTLLAESMTKSVIQGKNGWEHDI